jgi:hypothetical protein
MARLYYNFKLPNGMTTLMYDVLDADTGKIKKVEYYPNLSEKLKDRKIMELTSPSRVMYHSIIDMPKKPKTLNVVWDELYNDYRRAEDSLIFRMSFGENKTIDIEVSDLDDPAEFIAELKEAYDCFPTVDTFIKQLKQLIID